MKGFKKNVFEYQNENNYYSKQNASTKVEM